jgi:predicted amidohydrolase YtcJ
MLRFGRIALLCAGLSFATSAAAQSQRVDLLLHNGKVLVMDDAFSIRQAIAVRDGEVIEVGGEDLVKKYQANRVIDLHGRLLMPGFNDTHIHISGNSRRYIELAGTKSIEELRNKIRSKAKELGPGEWITGYGWAEDDFVEKRLPSRFDLDEAAPQNPAVLSRAGGHSVVANSLALKLAEITRDTPNPPSGVIERDKGGEPTGVIRESFESLTRLVPPDKTEELLPSFKAHLQDLLSLGITSLVQAGVTPEQYAAEWEAVYRKDGANLPRATVQILWAGREKMIAFGKKTGDGDDRLRVGAIKLFVDGGFTGPAAYTLAPYKNQREYRGQLRYSEKELYEIVKAGNELGWQMGFHTIGDGAIKLLADTFARVLRESPRPDHRYYFAHFSMLPPEDALKEISENHLLVSQQPNFTYTLEQRYVDNLEGARLQHNNPAATLTRHGIFMAFGSDILPIGPMVGLYAAVTRKGKSGTVYGPDEKISMADAIRHYTRDGAYLTRQEKVKGTLEPGKLADMIVVNNDLLTIDPSQILATKVDLAIVGGRVVYERASEKQPTAR